MSELIPFNDLKTMAISIANGGLFPALKNPDQVVTLLMLSQAEGIHPINALRQFHIIDGKPAMRADTMLAKFRSKGGTVKWITEADDSTNQRGLWTFEGQSKEIGFSIKEAQSAGYIRQGSNWTKDPASQLRARTISRACRMLAPEIVVGLYTPEELEDIPKDIPKDIRPGNIEVKARAAQDTPQESAPPHDTEPIPLALSEDAANPGPDDEAKRLKHLRGKFNQELLTVKTPKEFAKVRGDFERAHGKQFLKNLTGHKPGETFESLMTEHWKRVEEENKEGIWRANTEKCVAELLFRPLEEAILSKYIPNTDENFAILEKAGKRLRLPEYGWTPEWEAAQNGQKEVNS